MHSWQPGTTQASTTSGEIYRRISFRNSVPSSARALITSSAYFAAIYSSGSVGFMIFDAACATSRLVFGEVTPLNSMGDDELGAEIRRKLIKLKFIEGTCGPIEGGPEDA